uniref:Uncharacterized protein n=1 Tax=Hyaloperonospora arabidopsidis (strain Emoy2) TaxID=559515 RepID=M4BU86_HYAAE
MPSARRVGQKRSAMCTGGSSLDSLLFRETFARKLKAFLESAMVSFTQNRIRPLVLNARSDLPHFAI